MEPKAVIRSKSDQLVDRQRFFGWIMPEQREFPDGLRDNLIPVAILTRMH